MTSLRSARVNEVIPETTCEHDLGRRQTSVDHDCYYFSNLFPGTMPRAYVSSRKLTGAHSSDSFQGRSPTRSTERADACHGNPVHFTSDLSTVIFAHHGLSINSAPADTQSYRRTTSVILHLDCGAVGVYVCSQSFQTQRTVSARCSAT
jgi:hypothetical protein